MTVNGSTGRNAFRRFADLGYENLLPVKPGEKMPGVLRNGVWGGLPNWGTLKAGDTDLDAWHAMGAGVGLRVDRHMLVLDIDIEDEATAARIEDLATEYLGASPRRTGRAPRRMLFYNLDRPRKFAPVTVGAGKVECFTDGRHVVLYGRHPSGADYSWHGIRPRPELATIRNGAFEKWLDAVRAEFPDASGGGVRDAGDAGEVDQAALEGALERVTAAVRVIPNDRRDYDRYVEMGYAIKAALRAWPEEAYALWTEWADRYEDATPETWETTWKTLGPPSRVGASWLYEEAERLSEGAFTRADAWFDALPAEEAGVTSAPADVKAVTPFRLVRVDEILNREPQRWLVARHVPRVSMGFVYSEPGAGKSFLVLDMALAIAAGLPDWHGDAIDGEAGRDVLYIAAEGSYGFRNRIAAWLARQMKEGRDVGGFAMIEQTINFMDREDVGRLLATISGSGLRPALIVVDTVSRSLPGADENLQKDMTRFVGACDAVRAAHGCAVIGVHHAGKSGDMRGSTVLLGAGDFVFRLRREKEQSVGTLTCEKQKDGEDGWRDAYMFEKVGLAEGQSSIVLGRLDRVPEPQSASGEALLAAIAAAWVKGEPWSMNYRSGDRYAVPHIVRRAGVTVKEAETMLKVWLSDGTLSDDIYDRRSKKRGLNVIRLTAIQSEILDVFG